MPVINANGNSVHVDHVIKLDQGKKEAAITQAKKDRLDNIFIDVGADTYVGSGVDLPMGDFRMGRPVSVGNLKGKIAAINAEVNSPMDGIKAAAAPAIGLGVAAAAGTGGALIGINFLLKMFGTSLSKPGMIAVTLLAGLSTLATVLEFGHRRGKRKQFEVLLDSKKDTLKDFGQFLR